MSHSPSGLCQEVGGWEEQVNASEKGFKWEQANNDEEECAVYVYGEVTADACISLK